MKVYIIVRYGFTQSISKVFIDKIMADNEIEKLKEKAASLPYEIEYDIEEHEVIE